ncbi:hypothetical protein HanRHA438_Chr17g0797621 [Helianthus annuus]|nr:hypothetical protein HanRHA438_Chr17g0797621 [Helianthus annuus]
MGQVWVNSAGLAGIRSGWRVDPFNPFMSFYIFYSMFYVINYFECVFYAKIIT